MNRTSCDWRIGLASLGGAAAVILTGSAMGGAAAGGPGGASTITDAPKTAESSGLVLYVDRDAPAGGDGFSWGRAMRDLQTAMTFAASPAAGVAAIHVAEGVYTPDRGGPLPGDRRATFQLVNGLQLVGGFAGLGYPIPDQRDVSRFRSILSGDLLGNDLPQFGNYHDNSYSVVTASGTNPTTTIDGFTIRAGNANGPDGVDMHLARGAGMWILTGSPNIRNCTFEDNLAVFHGGGLYNRISSSPRIDDCVFVRNQAGIRGGAIFNAFGSNPTIRGTKFVSNIAGSHGGAMNNHQASPSVIECQFVDNFADEGGAISGQLDGRLTVIESSFEGNETNGHGGAIRVADEATVTVDRSVFRLNEADDGGAIAVLDTDAATIGNTIFEGNVVSGRGAALYDDAGTLVVNGVFCGNVAESASGGAAYAVSTRFINCTFSRNSGGGLQTALGGAEVVNTILWGNAPFQIRDDGGPSMVRTTDIQGGWVGPGTANMNIEPCFVQPGTGDVRLAEGSPCIDRGDSGALPAGFTTDAGGDPRVRGTAVDLGAYEGSHETVPRVATDDDVDRGEVSVLVPGGGPEEPETSALVIFRNISDGDDATVTVNEVKSMHALAEGFSELGAVLTIETSLADGDFRATVFVPFDALTGGGGDPLGFDVTRFDAPTGNWALAVAANTILANGHDTTIGDRHAFAGATWPGATDDTGDYGVFWNTTTLRGFVWANVDRGGDFAIGAPLCPADVEQPPNGLTDMVDVLAVLRAWARGDGPFDVNGDGLVDGQDVTEVFGAWGLCR